MPNDIDVQLTQLGKLSDKYTEEIERIKRDETIPKRVKRGAKEFVETERRGIRRIQEFGRKPVPRAVGRATVRGAAAVGKGVFAGGKFIVRRIKEKKERRAAALAGAGSSGFLGKEGMRGLHIKERGIHKRNIKTMNLNSERSLREAREFEKQRKREEKRAKRAAFADTFKHRRRLRDFVKKKR